MRYLKLGQRGDTIVEVLICIAVVSLVVSAAFVITNKSTSSVQTLKEHGGALKAVESQMEQLRGMAVSNPDAVFGRGREFCIQGNAVVNVSSSNCRQTAGGAEYRFSINETAENTFTGTVQWSLIGGSEGQNQLVYKVFRP